ncbi:hypothetical protein JYU34_022657 [Plutella xylostella]|uniref:unspecific monooxygenase n=1 Tax=Plutella xylostella TaxID=51655 RepID=A0ABQ7PPV4_PLUXY|nr:hypothetical protein JYU34_022657 [Plutella xylostella]
MIVLTTFVVLLSSLITLIFVFVRHKLSYWKNKNVPHPKPHFVLGNYADYILLKESLNETSVDICKQFPNEPIIGTYFGLQPKLIVQDPELIKLILTKDFYYFNGRELSTHSHKETATKNLFFQHGDKWRVLRQNMTPLFSSAKMKNMFHLIQNCAKQLEKLLDEETKVSNEVEIRTLMARFTMDCICSCAFGVDAEVMGKELSSNPFRKIADVLHDVSDYRGFTIVGRILWPTLFYALGYTLLPEESSKFFDTLLRNVFETRNGKPSQRQDFVDLFMSLKNNRHITGDAIKSLIEPGSEKVSLEADDSLLVSQCFLIFAAGFDTSSTTASFTLYELAKHPEIQEKVHVEVDAYLQANNGEITYECINQLPYLYQCIEEALRLYPVLGVSTRELYDNYTLPNGVTLEKGTGIYIPVYHMQRDAKYFPEPEKFRPERFSAEERSKITPYTYIPFGEGPRICIGMRFAKMNMIPGLVSIFRKFRVELAAGTPTTPVLEPKSISTTFRGGVHLKLIPRKG